MVWELRMPRGTGWFCGHLIPAHSHECVGLSGVSHMWTDTHKSHPQEVERVGAQSTGSAAGLQYCLYVNESPVRTADSPLHKAKSYKLLASSGLMSPWDVALEDGHGA